MLYVWQALRGVICKDDDWGGTIISGTTMGAGPLSGVCTGFGNRVDGGTPQDQRGTVWSPH